MTTTLQPEAASSTAIARPMPREAPVTMATLADPSAAMVVVEREVVVVGGEAEGEEKARPPAAPRSRAAASRRPPPRGVPNRLVATAVHADRPQTATAEVPTALAAARAGAAANAGVVAKAAGGAAERTMAASTAKRGCILEMETGGCGARRGGLTGSPRARRDRRAGVTMSKNHFIGEYI